MSAFSHGWLSDADAVFTIGWISDGSVAPSATPEGHADPYSFSDDDIRLAIQAFLVIEST